MDATYLRTLQTFTKAVAERNALLRSGRAGPVELGAFERTLAPAAADLIRLRREGLAALDHSFKRAYAQISDDSEPVGLAYQPNFAEASAEALLVRLESSRARDQQFRSTLVGPHRDDFHVSVRQSAARDFASEGQQRSVVLALRLAQAAWFQEKSGVRPVLLADDVLGELDPGRRARFWSAIDPESQIIATGTNPPDAELGTWQMFEVSDGTFCEKVPSQCD
jgi:DNA replication and repair protein RecF